MSITLTSSYVSINCLFSIKLNCPCESNIGIIVDDLNKPSKTSLASFFSVKVKLYCQFSFVFDNCAGPL